MVLQAVAVEGLIQAMGALTGALKESFAFSDKAQKASLSLGMTLGTARERLGGSMDQLRGSMEQRFEATMMTLEAGMRGNTAGVAKLINEQQLTGVSTAKTAGAMASLNRVMGMSIEETNALASNLTDTANAYGISSDKLVNAIAGMDKSMTQFNTLGTTAIPGAIADLTAKVGAPFEGRINQVADLLFSTGADALQKQAVLGLSGFREQLLAAGDDQAKVTQILEQAVLTAGDQVTNLAGGAGATFESFEAVKGMVGDAGVETKALADALRNSSEVVNTTAIDEADTFATLKSEVFEPLKTTVMDLYTAAFPVLKAAITKLKDIIETGVLKFKSFYVESGGLEGIFKKLKAKFHEFKDFLIVALVPAFTALALVIGAAVLPFAPLILAVTLITMAFVKFKEPIMEVVTIIKEKVVEAFKGMVKILGGLMIKIGSFISDDLENAGKRLQRWAEGGKQGSPPIEEVAKSNEEIEAAFREQTRQDAEFFGASLEKQDEQNEKLEEVVQNTAKTTTTSDFQAESFATLSTAVDAILGIGGPDVQSEMLEELRTLNDQTAANGENTGGGTAIEPAEA